MILDRRTLLGAALTGGALAALPAAALAALNQDDQALVTRAVAYLEGLSAAEARFTQTDPRGGMTQGRLYLQRPGKARFDYDPPSGLLVVSDGKVVGVADKKLKTVNRLWLSQTPLALFLAKQIRLDKGVTVTRVTRTSDGFSITAADAKKETKGSITLNFTDGPLALSGWTVTDVQGQTRVQLSGLKRSAALDPTLFVVPTMGRPRV